MKKGKSQSRALRRHLLIAMISCLLTVLAICTALFHITYRKTADTVREYFGELPRKTVATVSDAYYQQFQTSIGTFLDFFCRDFSHELARYGATREDYEALDGLLWNHVSGHATAYFFNTYCSDSTLFCCDSTGFRCCSLDTFEDGSDVFNECLKQLDADVQAHPEYYQDQANFADYIRVTAQTGGASYSKGGDGCVVVWSNLNQTTEYDLCIGILMDHANNWVRPIDQVAVEQSDAVIQSMDGMFRKYISIMVASAAGVLLVFILVSAILSKKLADPVVSEHNMLVQVNEMKTTFLSDASHELKTPLAAMSGYAQNAESDVINGAEQSVILEKLRRISSEANRMALMVTQILDATRIEEGRMVLEKAPCDLDSLVRSTVETYFTVLNKNNNRLAVRIPLELPPVEADSSRLQRVLVNLISNALRHTQNGTILIKAETSGEYVRVTVKDNGCGISAEDMPHIWERYYKGKHAETGTGLGLFICRFIVESHGGTISAESEPGKGTAFYFTLPIADPSEISPKKRAPAEGAAHFLLL